MKTFYFVLYKHQNPRFPFLKEAYFDNYEKVLEFSKIREVAYVRKCTYSCSEVVSNLERLVSENPFN